ncbi:MAG: hypothetical protein A3D75_02115 [Candidatus Levybacteria bacterium RIFCSPHIGHO2_02_FULL_37_18]|nr:MAG: hypothetical protein A3D75_02115 [Candidatus Levybacteria bacterium RIFCSPHIGHO2_02_FULL_37_18]OGH33620.1 MAG: hypothetical protein A3A47_02205 [Candidatus Levybacteria bacterium RIFCSPLOWO2_01_FULL_37_20]OGH44301.1 MAG: hypothetical protein A3J14_03805 [Candidatus Levybacteria bacterium RIFCSPLOWO2_02_FULL_37_18]
MKHGSFYKNLSLKTIVKSFFWFTTGAFLGLFFFVSFAFIIFQKIYSDRIFPGIMVNGVYFGGKTKQDAKQFFAKKNETISKTQFVFTFGEEEILLTIEDIELGYNDSLLATQAYELGRSPNIFSNVSLILQTHISGLNLSPSYRYSEEKLLTALSPLVNKVHKEPVNALFNFKDEKVTAFQPSSDGIDIDVENLKKNIAEKIPFVLSSKTSLTIPITLSLKTIPAAITTEKVNNLGIKEEIGYGTSLFQGSILNRVHNVTLAATRMNGVLIAPGEDFSFNKALGDISSFTGYKQAYVIQDGKTVLGDGGGVCQVSTTLFRSALNAGLPITQRHAHAYRVHYYEEDSPPGIDATVFSPSVDLRFKNDTGNYILIQSEIDPSVERLMFRLYGTKDGRVATVGKPVIVSQTPPPEPVYQDDPTLPKGVVKQVDFAASGANVYFTREVVKNGKKIISEKYVSNYTPWKAVFLRGTKEG